jgi:hypothetical protein
VSILTLLDDSSVVTDAGLSNVASSEFSCFLGGGTAPGNIVAGLNIMGFCAKKIGQFLCQTKFEVIDMQ